MSITALASGLLLGSSGEVAAAARLPAFQREWLQPYLRTGLARRARLLLQARSPAPAIPLLRRLTGSAEALQARYLLAHALLEDQQPAAAAALFDQLVTSYPLLADYCRFHAAQGFFRARDFVRAEASAAAVTPGSVLRLEAQLLRADALRVRLLGQRSKTPASQPGVPGPGSWSEVASLWAEYLRQHPSGGRVGQAHLRRGEALEEEATGAAIPRRDQLWREALEHYRQALIRAPLSSASGEARTRLSALAARLPDGPKRSALSGWDRFQQAHAYFRAQRNSESEAAFAAILQDQDLSPTLRCKAAFYQAKSLFKARQRAASVPVYEQALTACRKAGQSELTVKALFDLAKGLMHAKRAKDAVTRLAELEKDFPSHSYADDARLWAAEAYESLKQPAEVTRLLSSLPTLYPGGDMAHEALWRLARTAYLEKKPQAALAYLDQALALGRPRYYYSTGQAHYWKARILAQTGKPVEARAELVRCVRDYPLSYYALLSFNRLRDAHPAQFRTLSAELLGRAGAAPDWRFAPRPLFGTPGFLRGVELARLGFGEAAARELQRAGLTTRAASTSSEEAWLAALLYDRAGLWHLSHRLPAQADPELRRSYPQGEARRGWELAYPQAFPTLVRPAAARALIPEELVLSIMREESGFTPSIESYANAIGLMQLILPTARAAARQDQLQVSRERLRDPAVNIRLGATFLGFLHATFKKTVPLAVAGYNAGEGAVFRWLGQFGSVPLDEFIERIPYDQTRRYTKRVLSTLFTYSVLYRRGESRVPRLPQQLPTIKKKAFGS